MAKPSRSLSVHTVQASVVQASVFEQLKLSRDIFKTIPELVKLAKDRPEDELLARDLERIIDKLVEVGEALAESAQDTSGQMLVGVD